MLAWAVSRAAHFCKSALSRYTQWDFLALVNQYQIPFHERSHGQLFCNESAKDILNMLLSECEKYAVTIQLKTEIASIEKLHSNNFQIKTQATDYTCQSLVIASGGLSIPKMCATPLGYKIAEQFGIKVWPTMAGLVAFTLQPEDTLPDGSQSQIRIPQHLPFIISRQDERFWRSLVICIDQLALSQCSLNYCE